MNASIREVLGSVPSTAVLSEDRTGLMNRIRDLARRQAESLGIEVVDVRLTRTDLPQENLEATFARMRAEREREAADERARGNEAAQRVRALADRTVTELVSSAQRDAEIVRGEADADATAFMPTHTTSTPSSSPSRGRCKAIGRAARREFVHGPQPR